MKCLTTALRFRHNTALVAKTKFVIILLLSSMFIIGCGEEDGEVESKNYPPLIDKIEAYGNDIKQDTSMSFKIYTTDAESDPLEYTWEATAGEFDTTSEALVNWTASDEPGDVTITVSVDDGQNEPVTRTIDMTVGSDTKPEADILGAWELVSIKDNHLPHLVKEEVMGVPIRYVKLRHIYKADGTYITYGKYEYRFEEKSYLIDIVIFDISEVNIECTSEIMGEYSVEESASGLTLKRIESSQSDIESSYNKGRYDAGQIEEIKDLFDSSEEKKKQLSTEVEFSIDGDKMRVTSPLWDGEAVYERLLINLLEPFLKQM